MYLGTVSSTYQFHSLVVVVLLQLVRQFCEMDNQNMLLFHVHALPVLCLARTDSFFWFMTLGFLCGCAYVPITRLVIIPR